MGATSIQEQSILGAHDHMPGWPSELNVSTQASSGGRLVLHPPQDVMVVDASSPEDSSEDEPTNNVAQIGIVLANGKYKCNLLECAHKKFSRPAELRRHHDTIHAALKPEFWCRVPFCPRSAAAGGKAFRRKYRLQDHMRKLHNGGGSGGRVGLTEDANEDVSGDLEEWAICC
ncbi:hypothetical protein CC86DRAFT_370118 [Ophiobolus disseminans]|uniref:C2H2-type domain-containing protein n=1 Tax=Ophiobolus disseminans TaxID=1469910 RepID=A0A6A7A2W0_9PLEO|nr:hypothetical protein CC86DRAFT_370118 [Ophiobolus disseminans]